MTSEIMLPQRVKPERNNLAVFVLPNLRVVFDRVISVQR